MYVIKTIIPPYRKPTTPEAQSFQIKVLIKKKVIPVKKKKISIYPSQIRLKY